MKLLSVFTSISISFLSLFASLSQARNSTYFNPVLPGAQADPSCIRVEETFYCATSTFIAFPGNPIYASKDLINWKIISHAWNRESQLPGVSWGTEDQTGGFWAPTLRYHDGEFWLVNIYQGGPGGRIGTLFRTRDPYSNDAWGDPVVFGQD